MNLKDPIPVLLPEITAPSNVHSLARGKLVVTTVAVVAAPTLAVVRDQNLYPQILVMYCQSVLRAVSKGTGKERLLFYSVPQRSGLVPWQVLVGMGQLKFWKAVICSGQNKLGIALWCREEMSFPSCCHSYQHILQSFTASSRRCATLNSKTPKFQHMLHT